MRKTYRSFGPRAEIYIFLGFCFAELTYTGVIVFIKFSILALYWRLFDRTSIKPWIYVLCGILTSWDLAVVSITAVISSAMSR